MRYQVFKTKEGGQPVFTAPWYWLASAIAHWSSLNWDACRIVDSKVDETRLCWAKALPAGKKSNLDGVIMRLGFVKNTGVSAFLVAMLVVALRYGQKPLLRRLWGCLTVIRSRS